MVSFSLFEVGRAPWPLSPYPGGVGGASPVRRVRLGQMRLPDRPRYHIPPPHAVTDACGSSRPTPRDMSMAQTAGVTEDTVCVLHFVPMLYHALVDRTSVLWL